DKRYHIVKELVEVEKEYVESLQTIVEKYMVPLKNNPALLDASSVAEIFHWIPEIRTQHTIFLSLLENAWKSWTSDTTIGDQIAVMFKKRTVVEFYCSFIENFARSERSLETALQQKSAFQRFVE
uniref:DH domain-containing protein n=1 Tax=Macrostomum lignano TaxID=282301 RepID=A0A1I8I8Z2_9PLAT